jgi:dihydroneopterin aldolase
VAEQDRILLEGIVLYGRHGVLDAERELGQRFVVDLELRLDLTKAGTTDALSATVDYGGVAALVRGLVEGPPMDLIETVAERLAAAVLAHDARIDAVRVKVAKPDVRLDGLILAGAAVEILRSRG